MEDTLDRAMWRNEELTIPEEVGPIRPASLRGPYRIKTELITTTTTTFSQKTWKYYVNKSYRLIHIYQPHVLSEINSQGIYLCI